VLEEIAKTRRVAYAWSTASVRCTPSRSNPGEEIPSLRQRHEEGSRHPRPQQPELAFANTIEAIIHGANRVDATMAGMGRGAGNCPMELMIGFLRNPSSSCGHSTRSCKSNFCHEPRGRMGPFRST